MTTTISVTDIDEEVLGSIEVSQDPKMIDLTPVADVDPTETQKEKLVVIRRCECGMEIHPTGKPGRPATRCEACRKAITERKTLQCRQCEKPLPAPTKRGRPATICESCKTTPKKKSNAKKSA